MMQHADNAEIGAFYDESFEGPAEALDGMRPVFGTLATLLAGVFAATDFFLPPADFT